MTIKKLMVKQVADFNNILDNLENIELKLRR